MFTTTSWKLVCVFERHDSFASCFYQPHRAHQRVAVLSQRGTAAQLVQSVICNVILLRQQLKRSKLDFVRPPFPLRAALVVVKSSSFIVSYPFSSYGKGKQNFAHCRGLNFRPCCRVYNYKPDTLTVTKLWGAISARCWDLCTKALTVVDIYFGSRSSKYCCGRRRRNVTPQSCSWENVKVDTRNFFRWKSNQTRRQRALSGARSCRLWRSSEP